ncbi:MAG TPA: CGNR zinc finger domain-containing protein [Sphingomonas sp.]|nr:CGNR zinc finger domain-containing protein [Sphingomonas sp.]
MSDPTPFDAIGGNLALDFVNTVANRGNPDKRRDLLAALPDLQCWLTTFGLPAAGLVEADLEEARAIRERLHDLFRFPAHGQAVDEATLRAFGRDLRKMTSARRLRQQDERIVWGWAPDAGALHRSLFAVLDDAAELLLSNDLEKVRECQGPGCGWLFVDRSRGRPRRWCSMRDCGNKAKARRHYQRSAGG